MAKRAHGIRLPDPSEIDLSKVKWTPRDYEEEKRKEGVRRAKDAKNSYIARAVRARFTQSQARFMYENMAEKDHEHSAWHA
jgi:hypothetical protein